MGWLKRKISREIWRSGIDEADRKGTGGIEIMSILDVT